MVCFHHEQLMGQVLEAGCFAGGEQSQVCSPPKMPEVQCLWGLQPKADFQGHN